MLKNYLLNPDFLINVLYLTVFLFIAYKVLGQTLWANVKKKMNPWDQGQEKDFDRLIRRKMDLLRANSGLYVPEDESPSHAMLRKAKKGEMKELKNIPAQFKNLHEDLSWGTGEEVKKILKLFQREFNYTPNENNLREQLKQFVKENTIVENIHQSSRDEIITLLYNRMLFNYYLDEITENRFNLIKKISGRLNIPAELFAFSLQYTLLQNHELCFSNQLIWGKIKGQERIYLIELFFQKSAPQLNKSVNALNDLIRLSFPIADFIRPWKEITKESSLEDALLVLRAHQNFSLEDIKKSYKKLVQEKHPDKISALKFPKEIENNALRQFQIIQAAMDMVQKSKGK